MSTEAEVFFFMGEARELVRNYPPLAGYLKKVDQELASICDSRLPTLRQAGKTVSSQGKRIRPAILLLSVEACGAVDDRAITYAAVLEMIHTASLIHDDVIDESELRRGQSSARSRWGNKLSVLLGDHLFARSLLRLAEDGHPSLWREVTVTTTEMCQGEMQQLASSGPDLKEEEYLEIIKAKTASMFAVCGKIGAILGGGTPETVSALERYGCNFGMAFQIADDIFDLISSDRDLDQHKVTLPLIYALRQASPAQRPALSSVLASPSLSQEQMEEIREMTGQLGGFDYAWQAVDGYREQAGEDLTALPDSPARAALMLATAQAFPLPVIA